MDAIDSDEIQILPDACLLYALQQIQEMGWKISKVTRKKKGNLQEWGFHPIDPTNRPLYSLELVYLGDGLFEIEIKKKLLAVSGLILDKREYRYTYRLMMEEVKQQESKFQMSKFRWFLQTKIQDLSI